MHLLLLFLPTKISLLFSFSSHPEEHIFESQKKKGKERGGFKLSAKSKLYVQDMSEAKLSAPSVCSASAKLIVVALSLSSSNPFLLP